MKWAAAYVGMTLFMAMFLRDMWLERQKPSWPIAIAMGLLWPLWVLLMLAA